MMKLIPIILIMFAVFMPLPKFTNQESPHQEFTNWQNIRIVCDDNKFDVYHRSYKDTSARDVLSFDRTSRETWEVMP